MARHSHPAPTRPFVGGMGLTGSLLYPISWGFLHCDMWPPPSHTQLGSFGGWSHLPASHPPIWGLPGCSYLECRLSQCWKLPQGSGFREHKQESSHAAIMSPLPTMWAVSCKDLIAHLWPLCIPPFHGQSVSTSHPPNCDHLPETQESLC